MPLIDLGGAFVPDVCRGGMVVPGLEDEAVHVFVVQAEASAEECAEFQSLLSPDEASRAQRFAYDYLRLSFTIVRGGLRILLGRYLNTLPTKVRFVYDHHGKPDLEIPSRIRFNVSHSGRLALIGVTLDRAIGVDLEQIRAISDIREIAARFFAAEENEELRKVKEEDRDIAFYSCWTRKEAYLKATGEGLSVPLTSFRVTVSPWDSPVLVNDPRDRGAPGNWCFHSVDTLAGYAAAVAYRGPSRPLQVDRIVKVSELL